MQAETLTEDQRNIKTNLSLTMINKFMWSNWEARNMLMIWKQLFQIMKVELMIEEISSSFKQVLLRMYEDSKQKNVLKVQPIHEQSIKKLK